jgi:hypothetical protein
MPNTTDGINSDFANRDSQGILLLLLLMLLLLLAVVVVLLLMILAAAAEHVSKLLTLKDVRANKALGTFACLVKAPKEKGGGSGCCVVIARGTRKERVSE